MIDFTSSVDKRIGNYLHPRYNPEKRNEVYYTAFGDDPEDDQTYVPYYEDHIPLDDVPLGHIHTDTPLGDHLDKYIGAEVIVPGLDGALPVLAKVKKRKRD